MKLLFLYLSLLTLPLMCAKAPETIYESSNVDFDIAKEAVVEEVVMATPEQAEQKIIKEAYLRFETQDLDKTYFQIKTFISQNKGLIQSDNSTKSYNSISRSLVIRIPTQSFQPTIDSISNHVKYFDNKQISAKDITEEFIDLEARLKAKKTLEKRYLELLDKAKNVSEILEIERELSNIREEIEAKQGRLKYLENRVSLSTINIEFYKYTQENIVPQSYTSKMWNAIKNGFSGLSIFFLGILSIWPFFIIIGVVVYFIRRWIKKSKK
ncbi:MAG: DUF4349 domain-containing protein [Aestuariibaculum sp.]